MKVVKKGFGPLRSMDPSSLLRHHHRHGTHGHYSRRASVGSATGSKGNLAQYEGQQQQQKRDPSNHYGRTTSGTNPFEED